MRQYSSQANDEGLLLAASFDGSAELNRPQPQPLAPCPRLLHAVEPCLAKRQSNIIQGLGSHSRLHIRVHVKVIRRSESTHLNVSRTSLPRELYFFYEKNTGVSHFHVEAGADGQFPVEQAAGLLAMHCLVRGQSPRDYVVM